MTGKEAMAGAIYSFLLAVECPCKSRRPYVSPLWGTSMGFLANLWQTSIYLSVPKVIFSLGDLPSPVLSSSCTSPFLTEWRMLSLRSVPSDKILSYSLHLATCIQGVFLAWEFMHSCHGMWQKYSVTSSNSPLLVLLSWYLQPVSCLQTSPDKEQASSLRLLGHLSGSTRTLKALL